MTGAHRDTGLASTSAVALTMQESGGLRTSGSSGLSWEASEAVSMSRDVRVDRDDSARTVLDMAEREQELHKHVKVMETEDSSASTSVFGRDNSSLEFSEQLPGQELPDDNDRAQHGVATELWNRSNEDAVYAVYLPLEARQVTWRTGYGSGLATRSLDQICQNNGYAELNLADSMVGHGIQDQLSREVAGSSLEVGLFGSRSTDLMPGSLTQVQSGGSHVRTGKSVHTVAVHSKDTSVGHSDCCRRVNEAEETQQLVQEGKSSTELRMGVSSFPKISSDVLETLDPPCSTDSGFAPEPIPVGFSPYSSVVDPRPIELRSNPKLLPETRSVQAECGVCDDVEDSVHCLKSTCNGAGWSGQQVSGGESASAEHSRTIPNSGPEQPVCLTAEDSGVQVLQSGGSKRVESRRVTMDPTSGTPDVGKPMQPPELCHPNSKCDVRVLDIEYDRSRNKGAVRDLSSRPRESQPCQLSVLDLSCGHAAVAANVRPERVEPISVDSVGLLVSNVEGNATRRSSPFSMDCKSSARPMGSHCREVERQNAMISACAQKGVLSPGACLVYHRLSIQATSPRPPVYCVDSPTGQLRGSKFLVRGRLHGRFR